MNKTPIFSLTMTALQRWLISVALLTLLPIGDVQAQDSDGEGDSAPRVLHFITIDVAPWASKSPETGQTEGAFAEVVRELEQRTGFQIHTTLTPFARVDRELESGDHDCTILVPRSDDIVVQGALVTDHDIGVISHRDNPLREYRDLKGQRISLLRGSAISDRFDRDPDIEREYETDYLMALRKLERRRTDGIAGAIPTLLYLAQQHGLNDSLADPLKLTDIPLTFQCSHNSDHLDAMPVLNQALQAMKADGSLEAITDKFHF